MIKEVLEFITGLTRKPYSIFDQNGRATQVLVPDGYKPVSTPTGDTRQVMKSFHEARVDLKGLKALHLYISRGEEKPTTRDVFVEGPATIQPKINIALGTSDSGEVGRIKAEVPVTQIYRSVFGLNNMITVKPGRIQEIVRGCAVFLDPNEVKAWLNFTINREKRTEVNGLVQGSSTKSILVSPEGGARYQMPNSLTFTFPPFQEFLEKKVGVQFRLEPIVKDEEIFFEVFCDREAEFLQTIEELLLELVRGSLPIDFNVFVGEAAVINYEKRNPISKAFE